VAAWTGPDASAIARKLDATTDRGFIDMLISFERKNLASRVQ
jgi:hypothetical protein